MKKIVVIILGFFLFFYCNEVLKSMIGTKEDVVAYKEWLKKGNRGTMLEFLKRGYAKRSEDKKSEKLVKEKAELEKQLKIQELKLTLLQKQLDEALKGRGVAGAQAEDTKIKNLEKEVADLRTQVERLKKLQMDVGEQETESPETVFWRGKSVEVVVELQARLEQIKQYGKEAEEALRNFRSAPFEKDQDVLFQYLKKLQLAIKDSRDRSIELNDLKFDAKLSDAGVRVPIEYKNFSNKLEIEKDKFEKTWRPQQFFGLLPWMASDRPMREKIDEIRRTNLAWDKNKPHLKPAKPYEKIESVSIEYKPGEVAPGKPFEQGEEGVPPPPPPPVVGPSGGAEQEEKPKGDVSGGRGKLFEDIRKRRKE